MKFNAIAAVAATGIALSGCATIVTSTYQNIAISTPPTTGASCTLSSSKGNWNVTTPESVEIPKSKHNVEIHCSKSGWQDASATIPSRFQGWTLGNIAIGGLIGVGIDWASGAIHKYPKDFEVPMWPKQNDSAPMPPPPTMAPYKSPSGSPGT